MDSLRAAGEQQTLLRNKSDAKIKLVNSVDVLKRKKPAIPYEQRSGLAVQFLCIPINHEMRLLPCMINMFGLSIPPTCWGKKYRLSNVKNSFSPHCESFVLLSQIKILSSGRPITAIPLCSSGIYQSFPLRSAFWCYSQR
ncbi:hypothetical protein XENORESO_010543 [Xenotaenia resolanae]|uniref:Uncharacterized protein n=1 Tax=Xenotaenia resolanae TaxID=208358 RepID=A0ABV0WA65_9TELE